MRLKKVFTQKKLVICGVGRVSGYVLAGGRGSDRPKQFLRVWPNSLGGGWPSCAARPRSGRLTEAASLASAEIISPASLPAAFPLPHLHRETDIAVCILFRSLATAEWL